EGDRLVTGRGGADVVTVFAEQQGQVGPARFLVVHNQDARHGGIRSHSASTARVGSRTVKRLPSSLRLSTSIIPPCSSTIPCEIASPSPVAPRCFRVVKN